MRVEPSERERRGERRATGNTQSEVSARGSSCIRDPSVGYGSLPMATASLSTHVLDTGAGRPATGVEVELIADGLDAKECLEIAVRLAKSGMVDVLNVWAGQARDWRSLSVVMANMAFPVAPFLHLASAVKAAVDIPIIHAQRISDVATAGKANLAAMAPGVSGALITTVTGLLVAIPAMFGYNWLVTTLRGMIVALANFAAELSSAVEHNYVDHGDRGKF